MPNPLCPCPTAHSSLIPLTRFEPLATLSAAKQGPVWHLMDSTCDNAPRHCEKSVSTPRIDMPRLTDIDKVRAIGQAQAGTPQIQAAASLGVSPSTISKLKAKLQATGDVRDRPRSGRPKKTPPQEEQAWHDDSWSGQVAGRIVTGTVHQVPNRFYLFRYFWVAKCS